MLPGGGKNCAVKHRATPWPHGRGCGEIPFRGRIRRVTRDSRELSTVKVGHKAFDHWRIEVTGAGRIWYLVDPDKTTVWVDYAGPGHPKATD